MPAIGLDPGFEKKNIFAVKLKFFGFQKSLFCIFSVFFTKVFNVFEFFYNLFKNC